MENNKENKKKFFCKYLGQKVRSYNTGEKPILLDANSLPYVYVEVPCFLLLRSTKDITASELIELKDYLRTMYKSFSLWDLITERLAILLMSKKTRRIYYDLKCSDFFVSKGFCVGFMGLTVDELVSYGWVEIKQ